MPFRFYIFSNATVIKPLAIASSLWFNGTMIRLLDHLTHKKHVIFDYNGTILYDTDVCVEALNHLLESHHLEPVTKEYYREHFHFPIYSFYEKIGFDFERESFNDLGLRYRKFYLNNLHRCHVYSGLRHLLHELRQHPVTTSILTALNQESLHSQLKHYDLTPLFDFAFGLSDHHAHSKIQRGLDLIKHVGISPNETILIGDTDHDVEVAKALGIEVLVLADGHQNENRLNQTKAKVFNLERTTESRHHVQATHPPALD